MGVGERSWWPPRRAGEQSTEFLGRVLDELPVGDMPRRAREGHFDDYFCPSDVDDGMNMQRLVAELDRWTRSPGCNVEQRARIRAVIAAVKVGEFDGTKEESDRWAASKAGQDAMSEFPPHVRQTLFGDKGAG